MCSFPKVPNTFEERVLVVDGVKEKAVCGIPLFKDSSLFEYKFVVHFNHCVEPVVEKTKSATR